MPLRKRDDITSKAFPEVQKWTSGEETEEVIKLRNMLRSWGAVSVISCIGDKISPEARSRIVDEAISPSVRKIFPNAKSLL